LSELPVIGSGEGLKMFLSKLQLFHKIPLEYSEEFKVQKFEQNNFRILIISIFLVFEQAFYGLFVTPHDDILHMIYFGTAFIMLIFSVISLYFYYNKTDKISLLHKLYESSIGFCGLTIAIFRTAMAQNHVFNLPTVYVAVIYGLAVVFYYGYLQSFIIYFYGALLLIIILPVYQPTLQVSSYIADAVSNIIIAWLVSMFIYRKFVREFLAKKIIENKNEKLEKINKKLQKMSNIDTLTGIYNRGKIEEILNSVYSEAQRYKKSFQSF